MAYRIIIKTSAARYRFFVSAGAVSNSPDWLRRCFMKYPKLIAALLAASMITACTEPDGSPGRGIENGGAVSKANVGVAAGVVTGGLLGSAIGGGTGQTLAIIGGGLLGGFLGNEIGSSLDRADQAAYQRASQNALETGTTRSWRNPKTGAYGTIAPKAKYRNDEGVYCREYSQTIHVDGQKRQAHGTACREADGTWRIVE